MSAKYTIDKTTQTLVFTGKPKSLKKNSVKKIDKNKFTSVVIPNSVVNIEEDSFHNFRVLASVHIPNSVSTIGDAIFMGCSSLTSIHIPNSVLTIGYQAFWNCESVAFIHIPNSVSTIKCWAFSNCPRLHKACLPTTSKINIFKDYEAFEPQTFLIRPRIKPIISLQNKSACRASKTSYPIYL